MEDADPPVDDDDVDIDDVTAPLLALPEDSPDVPLPLVPEVWPEALADAAELPPLAADEPLDAPLEPDCAEEDVAPEPDDDAVTLPLPPVSRRQLAQDPVTTRMDMTSSRLIMAGGFLQRHGWSAVPPCQTPGARSTTVGGPMHGPQGRGHQVGQSPPRRPWAPGLPMLPPRAD